MPLPKIETPERQPVGKAKRMYTRSQRDELMLSEAITSYWRNRKKFRY